jgi:hypothetical protein
VFEKNALGRFKKKHACENRVFKYKFIPETGKYRLFQTACGEQLWQPDIARTDYRKAMPARFIKDKMKGCFDFLIADEVHQCASC